MTHDEKGKLCLTFYQPMIMAVTYDEVVVWFVWFFTVQIYEEAKKFAYQTVVKVAVAYGGAPFGQQVGLFVFCF